jgi:hypothetical protein
LVSGNPRKAGGELMESGKAAGERGRAASRPEESKGRRTSPSPPREDLTPQQRRVAAVRLFMHYAISDAEAYAEMSEDEVEDEYRRAGKLHRYNQDNEWQKRLARVARKHPPPEGLIPEIGDYLKLLEDDEKDDGLDQPDRKNN